MANNTILVVDDEIGIRELLSEILSDEGYRVVLAENAVVIRVGLIWYCSIYGCLIRMALLYSRIGQIVVC